MYTEQDENRARALIDSLTNANLITIQFGGYSALLDLVADAMAGVRERVEIAMEEESKMEVTL
jgi:hypothetical protein